MKRIKLKLKYLDDLELGNYLLDLTSKIKATKENNR